MELLARLLEDRALRSTVLGTQERAMAALRAQDFGTLLLERLAPVLGPAQERGPVTVDP